jgi:hypothetical protein
MKSELWEPREFRTDDYNKAVEAYEYHLTHKEKHWLEHRDVTISSRPVGEWLPYHKPLEK